jgi:hypothetical protein
MEDSLKSRVRAGRGKFAAMAATYTLGALNDNFFKRAAMLLVVYAWRKCRYWAAARPITRHSRRC